MGGSFLFVQTETRLESAMDTVNALPDGGATEGYIRDTLLVRLEATFVELSKLESKLAALDVDEVKVDFVRAIGGIKSIGRTYSSQLATSLGFVGVLQDAWSMLPPNPNQHVGQIPP